ncbi:MAG: aldehyde ferredoxin oxidoreductase C-terminal domain-containing protein [Nitrospinota bacterium]
MMTGHVDRILRVDLTTRRIWTEPLPSQGILRKYIGGTGLALHYLIQECPPGAKPTDPETPLIFMTGPLAGTRAPSSSNYVVVSLHYDIPYAAGAGFSHGFWAAFLKFAGYEGIIVTGAAKEPVYLLIDNDKVELRDAAPYWGKGTRETERRIKQDLDADPAEVSVACIGQAGESLLPGAMIKNDRNHGAGKGSPGALMGAKKLKAIAVRGTGQVQIAEPKAFLETVTQWEDNLFVVSEDGKAPLGMLWHNGGMTRHHGVMSEQGITAGKNLSDPVWSRKFSEMYMEACATWRVDPQPSYNCTIACAYDVRITSGTFSGARVSLCGGGEPFEGAAAVIGVDDPGAALVMTDHLDDIGMESGFSGPILGMAYEAYAKGIITKADTGGLELTWGNYEAALELLDQMIEHRGFGGKLAKGMKEAAEAIGGNAKDFLVHVKGAGINMHDWRPLWGPLFGQIIAGTGPAHQIEYPMLWKSKDAASEVPTSKVPAAQAQKIWEDCTGVCMFACQGVKDVTILAPRAVAQATGWKDFTAEEAMRAGERAVNMMRLVAVSRGFKKDDDFDVSPRLMEAPTTGPAAGVPSMGPHLKSLLEKYYGQMGWDVETGIPTRETIDRLGLGDVVNKLELGALIK